MGRIDWYSRQLEQADQAAGAGKSGLWIRLLDKAVHSKEKSSFRHLFWCLSLSRIGDSIQYLEGPNGTWKDYDRNLEVQVDPKIPIMILPGTIWSFQVLNRVQYLRQPKAPKKKRCSEVLFFLRMYDACKFEVLHFSAFFNLYLTTPQSSIIITYKIN